MATGFASFLVFVLAYAALLSLYAFAFGFRQAPNGRLAELTGRWKAVLKARAIGPVRPLSVYEIVLERLKRYLPALAPNGPQAAKLAQTLAQAGFPRSSAVSTFRVMRYLCTGAGVAIGLAIAVIIGAGRLGFLCDAAYGGVLGAVIPTYYLTRRARLRQAAIARQLSDALDLLVVSVEAGLGLFEAIKIVGTESERCNQEMGSELSRVATEIAAGASLGQALRNLAERTAVEDVGTLAATLIQSELLGAPIARSLRASSDALRLRRRLRAEESAHRTSVKILVPLAFLVLPAMLMVTLGPALIQILRTFNR